MMTTARDLRREDPSNLAAGDLDDYAAAWAQHFMVPSTDFARRRGEHDGLYRPRLLEMIRDARR